MLFSHLLSRLVIMFTTTFLIVQGGIWYLLVSKNVQEIHFKYTKQASVMINYIMRDKYSLNSDSIIDLVGDETFLLRYEIITKTNLDKVEANFAINNKPVYGGVIDYLDSFLANYRLETIRNNFKANLGDKPFFIIKDSDFTKKMIHLFVPKGNNVYHFEIDEGKLFFLKYYQLWLWFALGTTIIFLTLYLFLRSQLLPFYKITQYIESLKKGEDFKWNYKPNRLVSREANVTASEFYEMFQKINNFIQEKTQLFSNIRYDLTIPIARIRLLMSILNKDDKHLIARNLNELEEKLDFYLNFTSKLSIDWKVSDFNVSAVIKEHLSNHDHQVTYKGPDKIQLTGYKEGLDKLLFYTLTYSLDKSETISLEVIKHNYTVDIVFKLHNTKIIESQELALFNENELNFTRYKDLSATNVDTVGFIIQKLAFLIGAKLTLAYNHPHLTIQFSLNRHFT